MNNDNRIIEINGVKLEVDLRQAKRIDTLRVGDPVRVLVKGYGDTCNVYSGVVIGFEPFNLLPTIIVAYLEVEYSRAELRFLHLNAQTKDREVIAADMDALAAFDRDDATKALDREIVKAERALADLVEKKSYFVEHVARAWSQVSTAKKED